MLSYTTLQTIIQLLRMFFDILILWVLLYYTIKIVRNNSRTAQIFKGIVLILIIRAVANFFGFKAVDWLAGVLVTYGFLAIIIIFQPEIRSVLERLGKSSVFSRLNTLSSNERMRLVDELVSSSMALSQNRMGALITIEQGHSLNDFIKTGTIMNSLVTSDLIQTIFVPSTPLHDGAVIIQGDRIACASAYFPPTNLDVPSRYGARHRAAIGISEITDSVTIIISEKSGRISIAEEGKLITMNQSTLRAYLEQVILNDETDVYEADPSHVLLPQPKIDPVQEPILTDETASKPQAKRGFFKSLFKQEPLVMDVVEEETQTPKLPPIESKVEPPLKKLEPIEPEVVLENKEPEVIQIIEPIETLKKEVEKKEPEVKQPLEASDTQAETPKSQKPSLLSKLFKKASPKEELETSVEEKIEARDEEKSKTKPKRASTKKTNTPEEISKTLEEPPVKKRKKKPVEQKEAPQINLEYSVSDSSLLDDDFNQNEGGENT